MARRCTNRRRSRWLIPGILMTRQPPRVLPMNRTTRHWCYSERMSWWQNQIPDGAEAAIRSARKKIADGQPLGFDISEIIAAGQKKMNQAARKRKP